MLNKKTIGTIILAAGNSSRLGQPKQLLLWQGESMIRRTINLALAADCRPVMVVGGAFWEEIKEEIKSLEVDGIYNPNWHLGMGTSLQKGIERLQAHDLDAYLLLVCDQPFLSKDHILELKTVFNSNPLKAVASSYAQTFGVPAILSAAVFSKNFEWHNSLGAKPLLKQIPPDEIEFVPFPKGEIDIDTVEDWDNLQI
jgi:molybdenum cofactor cytidylyltransferase